ncbi:MAG: hypothetical protein JW720_11490 [Sedimentisphaerales bacterium]|nr:hypothetical protein [Sedimentisphaerales bacterium]
MSSEEDLQTIRRLARQGSRRVDEISAVASPGARAAAWAVKVKSLVSYNVYNVVAVVIGAAGTVPLEIGGQTQAVNLAESFEAAGALEPGTYAVMARVGETNVFYAAP